MAGRLEIGNEEKGEASQTQLITKNHQHLSGRPIM